MSNPVR